MQMPANKALPVYAVSSIKMSPLCSLAGNSGSHLPLICDNLQSYQRVRRYLYTQYFNSIPQRKDSRSTTCIKSNNRQLFQISFLDRSQRYECKIICVAYLNVVFNFYFHYSVFVTKQKVVNKDVIFFFQAFVLFIF